MPDISVTDGPRHGDTFFVAIFDAARALTRLADELEQHHSHATVEDLGFVLRSLDWSHNEPEGLYQQVGRIAGEVRRRLVDRIGWDEVIEIPGVPLALVRSTMGEKPKWDWERLVPRIASRAADEFAVTADPTTGEIVATPPGVLAERVAADVADCAGLTPSKQGRKGALTARGLDPDEFVTADGATPTVRFDHRKPVPA